VRGPLTIGEPAPPINVRLSAVDPYRPDTVADGGEAFGLVTRAASVRGLFKRYLGGSRQDDFCLQLHVPTRTLVVAVADGVSAAPRSHLGAALAVRQAAAAVVRQLDAGEVELDWNEVFSQAAWSLVEEHRRACSDSSAGVEEAAASLATTLAVAALTADDADSDGDPACAGPRLEQYRLQVAAVGDSPTLVLSQGKFVRVVGDEEDPHGLIGGGVRALPRHTKPAVAEPRTLEPKDVLLVCTDGLALPLADGKNEVGRTLTRELANPPDIVDFARLLDFSRSTYDDDRTLVTVWPQARR
jgi:serine/threonine protein phosphatase PrpC